jgi:RimJ/RimL family protein N-acetyltransferase
VSGAGPDLQPTLVGDRITLRPLEERDFEALHAAASDPMIWEQHPDNARYQRDAFEARFFRGAIASGGALAVIANDSGEVIGSSRYYEWDPAEQSICIGYTFIVTRHWGDGTNSEMKALMLDHAFSFANTVWFHIGEDNLRSRRAVEKLGAVQTRSEPAEVEGTSFTKLYYRLARVDNHD